MKSILLPISLHFALVFVYINTVFFFNAFPPFVSSLKADSVSAGKVAFRWKNIAKGFDYTRYKIANNTSMLDSEVVLLRFDPRYFDFHMAQANLTPENSTPSVTEGGNLRTFTKQVAGVAGINANFFDENGKALGLIVEDSKQIQKIHRGGNVLTGIFLIQNSLPQIIHRDEFKAEGVSLALQAGPRLIESGKPTKLVSHEDSSRRSGVAITAKQEVILYATVLRFPGASLAEIQRMLSEPELSVTDALNLDGGGSSQLFVERSDNLEEVFISGGDSVPVGLIVKKK